MNGLKAHETDYTVDERVLNSVDGTCVDFHRGWFIELG